MIFTAARAGEYLSAKCSGADEPGDQDEHDADEYEPEQSFDDAADTKNEGGEDEEDEQGHAPPSTPFGVVGTRDDTSRGGEVVAPP